MTATRFSGMLLSFPLREEDLSHTSILYNSMTLAELKYKKRKKKVLVSQ
jgi:hypothetical protein